MFLVGQGGQSHILRGSKEVGVTIESYGKVEISYINVDNFEMNNDRDIQFDIVIGHHERSNSAFSKFSRCLPFSKWLPKHGVKNGW
jgi:hypothetical protein